ncbi:AAA family ATPase [Nocardia sp. NPDC005978]|uniref:ATP-binding protein n=1 Tax=Nocardia sp. NPDC005978 TaxID=3156725 RepID=UPI0033BCC6F5
MSAVSSRGDAVPASTSEFVGREAELAQLDLLLSGPARLISLVGPGGVGKSALAAHALRQSSNGRPTHWVRLTGLSSDTDSLIEHVTAALEAAVDAPDNARQRLSRGLGTGGPTHSTILVLDGCESVLAATHRLINELSYLAPGITIVTTSREPIGGLDEYILWIHGLNPTDSLALFWRRTSFVGRHLDHDNDSRVVSREICRRLDHNPLFIRIAVARLSHQPAATILRDLSGDAADQRLTWTHPGRAPTDARHSSVLAVLEDSLSTCTEDQRILLERLTAFAPGRDAQHPGGGSGIELAAIIAVCADRELPGPAVEDCLDRLVDKCLLIVDPDATTTRYQMPETVRVFAARRLSRQPTEHARLAERHCHYYFQWARDVPGVHLGPEQVSWRQWSSQTWGNLRLAVDTACTQPNGYETSLEILTDTFSTWIPAAHDDPVASLLRQTMAAAPAPLTAGRADSLALISRIALWQGDYVHARTTLCASAAQFVPAHSWPPPAGVDIGLPAALEFTWGLELLLTHRDSASIEVLHRAARAYARSGKHRETTACQRFLALAHALLLEPDVSERYTRTCLHAEASRDQPDLVWMEMAHSIALARNGVMAEALARTNALLTFTPSGQDPWTARWCAVARIISLRHSLLTYPYHQHHSDREMAAIEVARLTGAMRAHSIPWILPIDELPVIAVELGKATEAAAAVLGQAQSADARAEGERLLREFVTEHVTHPAPFMRQMLDSDATSPQPEPPVPHLTPAEREVALLVAAGWTNRAIAIERQCSIRTIDAQVAAIRRKLSVSSRQDVAARLPSDLADQLTRIPYPPHH